MNVRRRAAADTLERRTVLLGAGAATAMVLSGCSIRLEDDAPRIPFVPTRRPIAGEAALLELLSAVQALTAVSVAPGSELAAALPGQYQAQAQTLTDALLERGVPHTQLVAASPAPTPGPTVASVIAVTGLDAADPELRPVLLAIQAHAVAVQLLSPEPPAGPDLSALSWPEPAALNAMLSAAQRAAYLLELAFAKLGRDARAAARPTLIRMTTVVDQVTTAAGSDAVPPELGYRPPYAVRSPEEATRLARESLAALLAASGAALTEVAAANPRASVAALPRWHGTIAAEAQRWGAPLTAFPGLSST